MIKQTKKQTSTKTIQPTRNVFRSHKFRAIIALIGLFGCGFGVGWTWRNSMSNNVQASGDSATVVISSDVVNQKTACQVIEDVLGQHVSSGGDSVETFARNARIYTLMAQQGCPENTEKFKALAQRELEIATGLSEYLIVKDNAAADVIHTYKKLNMQREAQDFLNKLQKLKDPAIDFIMKMETVINE